MKVVMKSLTVALGLSVCGLSGYLLYLLFKKDDDDDYLEPVNTVSKFKTLEVPVPTNAVSSLIGRGGQNIHNIEEQTNTKIKFKEHVSNTEVRICVIRGSDETCSMAENLIQEFVNNQPVIDSEDIWVLQGSVGMIIGRKGEKINDIRTASGAKVSVLDDGGDVTSRRINIKGTKEQILVAKSLIDSIIKRSQHVQAEMDQRLAKREPRLPPKKADSPQKVSMPSPKVEPIALVPGHADSQFEVYVSAMIDPSRFWLQIVGPKATELDCLVDEMTEYYNKSENRSLHTLDKVNKGDLVAAVFAFDNKWYRAEIMDVTDDNDAELFYVDYGDDNLVPCKELYELRTDFLRLHFQAIECFLAKIEPTGEEWSGDAVDKFEELTHTAKWTKLSAKIHGYSDREKTRVQREGSPVPGVELYDVNSERDVDIAEEMVKLGYAVYKKDADLRSNSRTTSISNISVASNS